MSIRSTDVVDEMNNAQLALDSIRVLQSMLSTNQWEPVRNELEFAIGEMKKCIPTEPNREAWNPNTCPTCGADLGGRCNDGYYDNPVFEICPVCRQRLSYA